MQLNELASLLIGLEKKFTSATDDIPTEKVTPKKSIQKPKIINDNSPNGYKVPRQGNSNIYSEKYAPYLKRFIDKGRTFNIAVVGTSRGEWLAILCELFPDSAVYGFDLNLDDTKNNIPNLKNLGAFSKNEPIIYEMDKRQDNTAFLQKIFKNNKISICIDNHCNSIESITKIFQSFLPFLATNFVYFIKDNSEVHIEILKEYPALSIKVDGELTIVDRNITEQLAEKVRKPFSVMFISHSSELNGAERCLFDLASKFVKRGIECCVVLHDDGPLKKLCNLNGVPVYIIQASVTWWCKQNGFGYNAYDDLTFFNISENIRNHLLPLVKNLHPNLIYSQTIVKPIGAILAQMAEIPHITSAREYGELDHGFNFRFGFRKSMQAIYEDSDIMFTLTNDVRNVLLGNDSKRASTVYISLSLDEKKLGNLQVAYRQINKNKTVKLCVLASIQESKGQLDAVRACKILIDSGYKIELNFYGYYQSHYMQQIQAFINKNNLSSYINVLPFDPNNLKLIYNADILLSCSVCEAFGRTMLEAALLKRPFVYANSGGPKEVFKDGVHALAYDCGDYKQLAEKIMETIEEPLAVETRVETAYLYVKDNFNDQRYVETQISAIENMLPNWKKRDQSACAKLIEESLQYAHTTKAIKRLKNVIDLLLPHGSKRRKFIKYAIFMPLNLTYKTIQYFYHHGFVATMVKILDSNKYTRLINKTIICLKDKGIVYTVRKITKKLFHCIVSYIPNGIAHNQDLRKESYSIYQNNFDFSDKTADIKALAFYLPQFYPIKENNKFYGHEFTEWDDAKKTTPKLSQHCQPRLPHTEIGEYELADVHVMLNQVKLAKQHGIYGFCFHYYWLNGKCLFEKPVEILLNHPEIDIPFCLCWSNPNGIKNSTVMYDEVLVKQHDSANDIEMFILDLKKYLEDKRYICIDGKPVIIVNNPIQTPNIKEVLAGWRDKAKVHGIGEILIWIIRSNAASALSLGIEDSIDAEIDFPLHWEQDAKSTIRPIDFLDEAKGKVFDYLKLLYKPIVKNSKPLYPCCIIALNNSIKRNKSFTIFDKFSFSSYYQCLRRSVDFVRKNLTEPERFLFINTWNGLAECSYLEPDEKYGYAAINTTSLALFGMRFVSSGNSACDKEAISKKLAIVPYFHNNYTEIFLNNNLKLKKVAVHLHLFYIEALDYFIDKLNNLDIEYTLFLSVAFDIDSADVKIKCTNYLKNIRAIIIEKVPKKVGNIAPLIVAFGPQLLQFDYICYLHSNTSQSAKLNQTYDDDIEALLGSKSKINQNLNLLHNNGKIVYNEPNITDTYNNTNYGLGHAIVTIFEKLNNYSMDDSLLIDLPEKSMFWARAEALKELLSLQVTYNDFAEESEDADNSVTNSLVKILIVMMEKCQGNAYCLYKDNSPTGFDYYEDTFDFSKFERKDKNIKILSYYLPQFDTNPINDKCHGKGFTEWTKVSAAQPLFYGHYQQHIPHSDIGYYHLTSSEILKKQASIMKRTGVYGQIFYHYWFSGQLILEKPAQLLLANKDINMPFCFCWANENWTKKWDGNESETILEQTYSQNDAKDFIKYLIPFFKDDRYIKVDGRAVLYIYRVDSFPNFQEYKNIWEEECLKVGLKSPFLVATLIRGITSPLEHGMDAAVERAPYDWEAISQCRIDDAITTYNPKKCNVFDYTELADHYSGLEYNAAYHVYKSIITIWDNTARYGEKAYLVHNSTPALFQYWLRKLINYTKETLPESQQFIIVNAWNEWAESAHLEPDEKFGYAYLNSIGRELFKVSDDVKTFIQGSCTNIDKNLKVGILLSDELLKILEDENSVLAKSFKLSSIFSKCNVFINSSDKCDLYIQLNRQNSDFGIHSECLENIVKMGIQNQHSLLEAVDFNNDVKYNSNDTLSIDTASLRIPVMTLQNNKFTSVKTPSCAIIYSINENFKELLEKESKQNIKMRKLTIFIDHLLGGGTTIYADNKINEILMTNDVLRVQYSRTTDDYVATLYVGHKNYVLKLADISMITLIEHYFRIENIIINSIVGYKNLEKVVDFINALKTYNIIITYMMHDYYALCPQYQLLDSKNNLCNFMFAGYQKWCNKCMSELLANNQTVAYLTNITKCNDIEKWHNIFNRLFVYGVDNVIVFSQSSLTLLKQAFPEIAAKISLIPHAVEPLRQVRILPHKSLNIATIGSIGLQKGSQILNDMNTIILEREINVKLFVIGILPDNNNRIHVTGEYKKENLPDIIEELQIDIVFMSSISVETFSYTTSEAMSMGLPIACFNLGAQAEKVSKYEKGLIISQIDACTALDEIIHFMTQR